MDREISLGGDIDSTRVPRGQGNPQISLDTEESTGEEVGERIGGKGVVHQGTGTSLMNQPLGSSSDSPNSTPVAITLSHKRRLKVFDDSGDMPPNTDSEIRLMKLVPGTHCSNCAIGAECDKYTPGDLCHYSEAFDAFPLRNAQTALSLVKELVETNKRRLLMALHSEKSVQGGALDDKVTALIGTLKKDLLELIDLENETSKVTIETHGSTPEEAGRKGRGILATLFGQPSSPMATPHLAGGVSLGTEIVSPNKENGTQKALSPSNAKISENNNSEIENEKKGPLVVIAENDIMDMSPPPPTMYEERVLRDADDEDDD